MKSKILIGFIVLAILSAGLYLKRHSLAGMLKNSSSKKEVKTLTNKNEIQNGDIIFQASLSDQSKAIKLATHSKYSHCGIIYKTGNEYFVYEAIQPVKTTPLKKWIARGDNGHYVIKRLKNADEVLTKSVLEKLKNSGQKFAGKNYDLYFEWSDDRIYCSELIWKMYKEATGLEIGKLQKLKDFDLSFGSVKAKMKERYGNNIPLNEIVVSPASMFNSELLETVISK